MYCWCYFRKFRQSPSSIWNSINNILHGIPSPAMPEFTRSVVGRRKKTSCHKLLLFTLCGHFSKNCVIKRINSFQFCRYSIEYFLNKKPVGLIKSKMHVFDRRWNLKAYFGLVYKTSCVLDPISTRNQIQNVVTYLTEYKIKKLISGSSSKSWTLFLQACWEHAWFNSNSNNNTHHWHNQHCNESNYISWTFQRSVCISFAIPCLDD